MNPKIFSTLLAGILLITTTACNDAKTTTESPAPNNSSVSNKPTTEAAKTDAQSDLRAKQLEADIRAREERNKVGGNQQVRDDSDLASEVRSKLEANIPGGNLTVAAKDAIVTVSGTVPKQDQIAKIEKLGMGIKGVKSVKVKVLVSSKTK
jgi:hyperosmotically inducible periplasmic protein